MAKLGRRAFVVGGAALGGAALVGATATLDTNTERRPMKVLVLTGSPRKNGNTNTLAARFIEGAKAAGHDVFRFDAAESKVSPCRACNACGMNGPCVIKDDFEQLREKLVEADVIAFATPMYYFGFSSQLKAVIDRFYACGDDLKFPKKAALIVTLADTNPDTAAAAVLQFRKIAAYEGWADGGVLVAPGLWSAGDAKNSPYADQAYALGKSF